MDIDIEGGGNYDTIGIHSYEEPSYLLLRHTLRSTQLCTSHDTFQSDSQ